MDRDTIRVVVPDISHPDMDGPIAILQVIAVLCSQSLPERRSDAQRRNRQCRHPTGQHVACRCSFLPKCPRNKHPDKEKAPVQ
jgi:hypothetical protein